MEYEYSKDENVPTIPEYFKNKSIFITGGSGFLGQALVEKLLYSCSELDRIYLLMRKKKEVLPEDRMEKLYSSSCFDRLRREKPTIFKEKVTIVAGDVLGLGLDLSSEDRALLIENVHVVFHAAASVRFNDPLSYAVKLNLRGTREVVTLAKEMKNLSSFIHVSTSYCNCKREIVDEVLYTPQADWREVLDICETLDEQNLQVITPKLLNGMPNTYVFTKQLSEHMLSEERGRLPVAIVRPSIVTGSLTEPAPGWVNNLNGPGGLYIAIGKGIKYAVYGNEETVLNFIPLDVCIRNFILTAWAIGTNRLKRTDDIPIFNCAGRKKDMLTLRDLSTKSYEVLRKWPLEEVLWYPKSPVITNNLLRYFLLTLFCSIIPAILVDIILGILGKKPRLLKIQRKVFEAELALNYFMSHDWQFLNENFLGIRKCLKEEDTRDFYYDIDNLFVDSSYIETGITGGQKYLLNVKHDNSSLRRARKLFFRMKMLDLVCRIFLYGCVLWMIINMKFVQNAYQTHFLRLK